MAKYSSEQVNNRLLLNVLFLALSFLILLNLFLTNSLAEQLQASAGAFIPPPVKVTYLDAPACETCYNVTLHGQILSTKFGVVLHRERLVDYQSEEGQQLIANYSIAAVPTVIVSPPAQQYPGFIEAFAGVGTMESDGNFVFRQVDFFGEGQFISLS